MIFSGADGVVLRSVEPVTEQGKTRETEIISDRLVRLARAASGDQEAIRAESAVSDGEPGSGGGGSPPEWPEGRAGRLVERWLPGGTRVANGLRSAASKRRGVTVALVVAAVAAVGMGIASWQSRPVAEPAPALPAAINVVGAASSSSRSAGPPSAGASATPDGPIVVSVVGKVASPGLVRLRGGSRVDDAIRAAGGALPAVDLSTLNLARKLSDGEQVYVGIPVPPGVAGNVVGSGGAGSGGASSGGAAGAGPDASGDSGPSAATPKKHGKKSRKSDGSATALSSRVNLNTATANDLETLPGVGPATAQRIVNWRTQHGQFTSVDDLREVGGIGDARLATLRDLVTT
jgi:competence protein ComEA